MGLPTPPPPALLIVAVWSRYEAAFFWARERAIEAWGPVALASPLFPFTETDYYASTMGPDLKKTFLVFERKIELTTLVDLKLQTNAWEVEYADLGQHAEPRPLNLDPGYLTLAKLVLASTKDHAHRIYLERGIYAEVTLYYKNRAWQAREWTFADYRRPEYHAFFQQARNLL